MYYTKHCTKFQIEKQKYWKLNTQEVLLFDSDTISEGWQSHVNDIVYYSIKSITQFNKQKKNCKQATFRCQKNACHVLRNGGQHNHARNELACSGKYATIVNGIRSLSTKIVMHKCRMFMATIIWPVITLNAANIRPNLRH